MYEIIEEPEECTDSRSAQDRRSACDGLLSAEPTRAQVFDACLSYRHDFGIMDKEKAMSLQYEAMEWLRCWRKALGT